MKSFFFSFLLILIFVRSGFCDEDLEFKTLFQKDSWAFEQLARQYVDPSLFAPPLVPVGRTHKKKTATLSVTTPVVLSPVVHKFSSENAWCSIKATVTDKHGNFNVNIQSGAAVVGWELNTDKKVLLKSGDANQMYVFGVDINQNFTNNLVLTLYVIKDGQTNPVFLNLF